MSDTRFIILGIGLIFAGIIILSVLGAQIDEITAQDEFQVCYEYHADVNGTGKDAFVAPRSNNQWDSWKISNTKFQWESPYEMPTDANVANSESYQWDENAYQANNQTGWIKVYG